MQPINDHASLKCTVSEKQSTAECNATNPHHTKHPVPAYGSRLAASQDVNLAGGSRLAAGQNVNL